MRQNSVAIISELQTRTNSDDPESALSVLTKELKGVEAVKGKSSIAMPIGQFH
jgi:hypothetical protein